MSCLITMSQMELHRLELIQRIRGRSLTVVEAAALLRLSRSQVHRLLQAYDLAGADGLVSKKRGRPSNRRHSEDFRNAGSYSAKHVVIDLQVAAARTRDRSPEEIRDTLIDAADVIRTLKIVLDGKD